MAEVGLDMAGQESKSIDAVDLDGFDLVGRSWPILSLIFDSVFSCLGAFASESGPKCLYEVAGQNDTGFFTSCLWCSRFLPESWPRDFGGKMRKFLSGLECPQGVFLYSFQTIGGTAGAAPKKITKFVLNRNFPRASVRSWPQ